jgi:hypothetical protein
MPAWRTSVVKLFFCSIKELKLESVVLDLSAGSCLSYYYDPSGYSYILIESASSEVVLSMPDSPMLTSS